MIEANDWERLLSCQKNDGSLNLLKTSLSSVFASAHKENFASLCPFAQLICFFWIRRPELLPHNRRRIIPTFGRCSCVFPTEHAPPCEQFHASVQASISECEPSLRAAPSSLRADSFLF